MKNLIITFLIALISFSIIAPEAEAKRFGGGRSSGMSRQVAPKQPTKQPATAPQKSPGQQTSKPGWLGPIAGLAAGLGLAALFSHLGLGEGFASFFMLILLVGAAFFIFRMLSRRSKQTDAHQYAGVSPYGSTSSVQQPIPQSSTASFSNDPSVQDFDAESFTRQAKLNFIRLQAANDRGDLDDIRQFTTPEMFAEVQLQLQERGNTSQQTDVIDLNADIVEVLQEDNRYIVTVRFSGLLREEPDSAPTGFDEMWHLVKPIHGSDGWRIVGIQQIA